MLSTLLNTPKSNLDWATWSLAHKLDHDEIIQGVADAQQVTLPQYQLDPIPMDKNLIADWLQRNQEAHNDMNGQLGLQSVDLEEVDLTDQRQLQSWIYLHYQEHYSVRAALRI